MESLSEKVLADIKNGKVTMRPKRYYSLLALLYGLGLLLALLSAIYFASFILYALSSGGFFKTPGYGWQGVYLFVLASPWFAIMLLMAFLGVLALLVSYPAYSYRRPLVYSLVGIVLVVVALGSFLHQTSFHNRMERFAQERGVPGMMALYERHRGALPPGVVPGIIVEVSSSTLTLTTPQREVVAIVLTEDTRIDVALESGTPVVVFGTVEANGSVTALGVRPLPSRFEGRFMPPPPLR